MPSPHLLIYLLALSLILGLIIWLISAFSQLYLTAPPLLVNLLLFLAITLFGLLIAASVYYYFNRSSRRRRGHSRKRRRRRTQVSAPESKTEAAGATLKALRQQVSQIQDEVAQQALLERSQEIEASFSRRELRVVVFGTGSAGKTSLVNALLGGMGGEVSAPMGTTQVGETYSLELEGLERQILITDTPGILEAGVTGTQREQSARQLATEADLLLFIIDNDLRQSEYEPLQRLAEIGKRSLLVFNKTDLYNDRDKEIILAKLRDHLQAYIASEDVVSTAANPQPATVETGEVIQPDIDVIPLIKRLAEILRDEGENLIADNILLQSQRLGEEARNLIDGQRQRQAEKVIQRYQWASAGVIAATPIPVVDMLGSTAVNAQMIIEIGKVYGCELDWSQARELASSLGRTLVGLGVVKGAIEIFSAALEFAVATYVVGKAIEGVTAAYLTWIAGKSFMEYFRRDQDWGDGGMSEVVQRQFQLNRRDEFIKAFVQEAIERVVKPLTENSQEEDEEDEPTNSRHQQDWEDKETDSHRQQDWW